MARDIVLLVNPVCSGTNGLRLVAPVVTRLRRGGARVRVTYGTGPGQAGEAARAATRDNAPDALVALGGDGLVNVALQAAADTGTALGIVPGGTGNDIARTLGIPRRDPLAAADVAARGALRTIDAGRCAGRWFAGVASAGFDSRVTERANGMSRPRGRARYFAALTAELGALRPFPFILELDGRRWETDAAFVSVGNGSTYGAGMRICPNAALDDGLLDVTVVGPVPRHELVRVFPSVYRGRHLGHPAVTSVRARTVSLAAPETATPAGPPEAYADGERFAPLPVTCESVPDALRVLVPSGKAGSR